MSKLKVGGHVVFIDAYRRERDALLTAIWGDPDGRLAVPIRKSASELTEEEKASGEWELDHHTPPLYANKVEEGGLPVIEYIEPGQHWPCVNLVIISDNEEAQDQYGRQIDDRHTSITHWKDNSALGYCYRLADEEVDWSRIPKPIK